jgi:hypothetical protein
MTPTGRARKLQCAGSASLVGQQLIILLAYAAHVPYGLAIGLLVQRGDHVASKLDRRRRPVVSAVGTVLLVLALWLEPWRVTVPTVVPPHVDVAIVDARFVPQFVRVTADSCAVVVNLDEVAYDIATARGMVTVSHRDQAALCFDSGIQRVRTRGDPFDGGFLIIDSTMEPSP